MTAGLLPGACTLKMAPSGTVLVLNPGNSGHLGLARPQSRSCSLSETTKPQIISAAKVRKAKLAERLEPVPQK